jgi:hypothetical protein
MIRLIPAAAAALVLVACSNGSTNADSTTSAPPASAPATPPAATSVAAAPTPTATASARADAPLPIRLAGAAFDGYTIKASPGAEMTAMDDISMVKTPGYQVAIDGAKARGARARDTAAKVKSLVSTERTFKRFIIERDDGFAAEATIKFFGMRWVPVGDQTIYVEISSRTEQGQIEGFEAAGTITKK